MKSVYIAGPFTGEDAWEIERNVHKAEAWILPIAKLGGLPVCPHTMFRNFYGTMTANFWYEATLQLLERCNSIFLLSSWEDSRGSVRERERAQLLSLPVFENYEDLRAWLRE